MNLIDLMCCETTVQQTKKRIDEISKKAVEEFEKESEKNWSVYDFLKMWVSDSYFKVTDFIITNETIWNIFYEVSDTLKEKNISFEDSDIHNLMETQEAFVTNEALSLVYNSIPKNSFVYIEDKSITFDEMFGEYEMLFKKTEHYYESDERYSLYQCLLSNTKNKIEQLFFSEEYDFDEKEQAMTCKKIIRNLESVLSFNGDISKEMIHLVSSDAIREFLEEITYDLNEWFRIKKKFFDDLLKVAKALAEGRFLYIDLMTEIIVTRIENAK